jgi:hypothetical protein
LPAIGLSNRFASLCGHGPGLHRRQDSLEHCPWRPLCQAQGGEGPKKKGLPFPATP